MKILVVLDFDDTMVEGSVEFQALTVAPPELVDRMLLQMNSNDCASTMQAVMSELHKEGFGKETITERVLQMKVFSGLLALIKKANEQPNTDMIILSGANTELIDIVLRNTGIRDYFKQVIANPSHFDDCGRLCISSYHKHKCSDCIDLCKGTVLRELLAKTAYSRVIYVGDGENDLCPSMILSEKDHVVAREGYPLAQVLHNMERKGQAIKAHVHVVDFWSDQLEPLLTSLLP